MGMDLIFFCHIKMIWISSYFLCFAYIYVFI